MHFASCLEATPWGGTRLRPRHQEALGLVQLDWDGEVVWKFDRTELVEEEGEEPTWMVRMHHDWQREGSPAGYYAPGAEPMVHGGRTLILAHRNVMRPEITDKLLEDDYILEVGLGRQRRLGVGGQRPS